MGAYCGGVFFCLLTTLIRTLQEEARFFLGELAELHIAHKFSIAYHLRQEEHRRMS